MKAPLIAILLSVSAWAQSPPVLRMDLPLSFRPTDEFEIVNVGVDGREWMVPIREAWDRVKPGNALDALLPKYVRILLLSTVVQGSCKFEVQWGMMWGPANDSWIVVSPRLAQTHEERVAVFMKAFQRMIHWYTNPTLETASPTANGIACLD